MDDFKQLMQHHYLKVCLLRHSRTSHTQCIRWLETCAKAHFANLWDMHDGKLHKVANVAGQTMALHPHGDAPITEASSIWPTKGIYSISKEISEIFTPGILPLLHVISKHASRRLAIETMFNPELTETIPSYDGRRQEPIYLPAKIPLLLMQGAEGIAVGMSTHILPHNFVEFLRLRLPF